MKNLAQFKKRLIETIKNDGTVDFSYQETTTYKENHPFHTIHPEGVTNGGGEQSCKIGRSQTNAFTRIKHNGRESWLDFGKAANWQFPDENTAVHTDGYESTDHSHSITLTYKFNQI